MWVQLDFGEADPDESALNGGPAIPEQFHVIRGDLEARLHPVVPDSEITGYAQPAEVGFAGFHLPESLRRYGEPVHHAARQTGRGRRIPDREIELSGGVAHVSFVPPQFGQR
jgi:hypothetical protein